MKGVFVILILAAIAAAWFYLPASHHRAATGTYFVRGCLSFTTPSGVVTWSAGQEIREDLKALRVEGSKTVTDGKFTAVLPEAVLTQDIEDAQALRLADGAGQTQADADLASLKTRIVKQPSTAPATAAQDRNAANAQQVAASTVGADFTAPNDFARAAGYNGYAGGYGYTGGYGYGNTYYDNSTTYIVHPFVLPNNRPTTTAPNYVRPLATPVLRARPLPPGGAR